MELNTILNNYCVIGDLGGGGYGQVFLAEENITKELRALKKLHHTITDQRDLIHEIQNVARIKLPNVVTYYHHFKESEILYFVMEYCPGGNLATKIQSGNIWLFRSDHASHFGQTVPL